MYVLFQSRLYSRSYTTAGACVCVRAHAHETNALLSLDAQSWILTTAMTSRSKYASWDVSGSKQNQKGHDRKQNQTSQGVLVADISLYQHTMRHNQALSQSSSYSTVTWLSLSTSYSTIKWFSNLTKIQDEQPTIRTFPQRSSGTRAGERTTLKSVYGRSPLSLHGPHTEKTKLKKKIDVYTFCLWRIR